MTDPNVLPAGLPGVPDLVVVKRPISPFWRRKLERIARGEARR